MLFPETVVISFRKTGQHTTNIRCFPDFDSIYLFKKLLPISLPFYKQALCFTKSMYFMVTPNHRQGLRAWMVWSLVSDGTNHGMEELGSIRLHNRFEELGIIFIIQLLY